jgi:hypothetical protein
MKNPSKKQHENYQRKSNKMKKTIFIGILAAIQTVLFGQIDTSNIAILPYDSTEFTHIMQFKNCKQTTLTNNDYSLIEKLLTQCIAEYNLEQEKLFNEISSKHPDYNLNKKHFVIDLTQYKRQYIVVINDKGEKEVWINCFCNTFIKGWRKEIIMVKDGGNCYFNLKINLTTEKYYDLSVNGEA